MADVVTPSMAGISAADDGGGPAGAGPAEVARDYLIPPAKPWMNLFWAKR